MNGKVIVGLVLLGFWSCSGAPALTNLNTSAYLAKSAQKPRTCRESSTSEGFWVNPCQGLVEDDCIYESDKELAYYIYTSVDNVLNLLVRLKERFTQRYFGQSFICKVIEDEPNHYSWLPVHPEIPKHPGLVNETHLPMLNFYGSMPTMSHIARRLAVGLELLTLDAAYYQEEFRSDFQTLQNYFGTVMLCQLDNSMNCNDIAFNSDPGRSIVPESDRCVTDQSARNYRNFRILKELVNGVEYLQQVYAHFSSNAKYSDSSRCRG